MTEPVFQRLATQTDLQVLARGGPVHLLYDLYPGYVRRVVAGRSACIDTSAITRAGLEPPAPADAELGASWFFAAAGALTVDLSQPLAAVLRARSSWGRNRSGWDSVIGRLTPASLMKSGFTRCADNPAGSLGEQCWCRAGRSM